MTLSYEREMSDMDEIRLNTSELKDRAKSQFYYGVSTLNHAKRMD